MTRLALHGFRLLSSMMTIMTTLHICILDVVIVVVVIVCISVVSTSCSRRPYRRASKAWKMQSKFKSILDEDLGLPHFWTILNLKD
jgi:uncharacterized protein HemY